MLQDYRFSVNEESLQELVKAEQWVEAFDLLVAPVHEWLYEEQQFEAIQSRSTTEQLILGFDYVQMQVAQGGFIQLIQNGYTPLLVLVIEALQKLGLAPDMVAALDDVLKVFVLNKDVLDKETSVEEFGRLYSEFKEFEGLEERYFAAQSGTLKEIVVYIFRSDIPQK